jgi:hypothetical protein
MKAIVFAYKRPELTEGILLRIIKINSEYKRKFHENAIEQIVLAHDGIREEEENYSQNSHQEARELCLYLESIHPQVSTLIFEDNVGHTGHMFRIIDILDGSVSDYIRLEEDKAPTMEGIEFLIQNSKSKNHFSLLDTLPLNKHLSQRQKFISTLFTDNGNLLIGEDLYDLAKHLWSVKDKYHEEFEKNLHAYLSNFLSGYSLKRAFGYYSKFFSWGLTNVDRPDSLLSYALILSQKLKVCPTVPLSENWSDRDTRGKNVNIVPDHRGADCNFSTTEIWGFDVCPRCEKQGVSERIELNRIGALKVGLNYRISKYRNSKQKQ